MPGSNPPAGARFGERAARYVLEIAERGRPTRALSAHLRKNNRPTPVMHLRRTMSIGSIDAPPPSVHTNLCRHLPPARSSARLFGTNLPGLTDAPRFPLSITFDRRGCSARSMTATTAEGAPTRRTAPTRPPNPAPIISPARGTGPTGAGIAPTHEYYGPWQFPEKLVPRLSSTPSKASVCQSMARL